MKSHRLFVPQSMIPAMLSGAKTQHRVPVKRKLGKGERIAYNSVLGWNIYRGDPLNGDREPIECPYQPGEEVWCPETWRPWWDEDPPVGQGMYCVVQYHADGGIYKPGTSAITPDIPDECRGHRFAEECDQAPDIAWRTPATMPRWAARIVRAVKAVRVERVQDITASDVEAEGVPFAHMLPPILPPGANLVAIANVVARTACSKVWDATHGPGAWDRNDWVWVLDFEEAK